MKTMKTCKYGCGKMATGGVTTVKKVKKMAMGGSATNKLNNAKGFAKATVGGSNTKDGIYAVPNAGPTGPNRTGTYDYKKGGTIGNAKFGASTPVKTSCKKGMVRSADGKCVMERPKFQKGGSAFGMLSVKAGVDKNPKPTAADRIAGAKLTSKKMGGSIKKKK
jgi:hypothetical protein